MLIARQSTGTRIPVRLVDSTGAPVVGIAPSDVLSTRAFVVKGDGTTTTVTLITNTTWFEIDQTDAPGLYHVLLGGGGSLGVLGPTQMSIQPAATAFVGIVDTFLVEEYGAKLDALDTNVNTLISSLGAINTKLGTPSGASMSADIGSAITAANSAATAAGSANTSASAAATAALIIRKIQTNRWKVVGNQLVVFDDDKTTPYLTCNLFDDTGAPTMTKIFERVPTP
jgi:hypothetical protein